MTTRLTLAMNERVIKDAKKYAAKKGISVSELVENYLKTLIERKPPNNVFSISPRVIRLRGSVKLPADFKYKKALEKAITKKHGK